MRIQNFAQLNQYLEKADGKLHSRPERDEAKLEKIKHIIQENLQVVNGAEFDQVERFVWTVKHIAGPQGEEDLVKMAIHAVASTSDLLELDAIRKFKDLDETLYYKSLAIHISNAAARIPIDSLGLSEEEMMKVMPWVTRLAIGIGEEDQGDNFVAPIKITDDLVKRLIENAPNLEMLSILDCHDITGSFLGDFESLQGSHSPNPLQNLKELKIEGCDLFNHSLSLLQNLESIEFKKCLHFNQNLNELQNLKSIEFEVCDNFNQSFNGLPNLEKLVIDGCDNFNQSLNDLKNLRELKIWFCIEFNQSLIGLPNLRELEICHCSEFDQSLTGLPNLRRLEIKKCRNFNQSLNGVPSLRNLKIESCKDFNQSFSGLQNLSNLVIYNISPSFRIKDLQTAVLIEKFSPEVFPTYFQPNSDQTNILIDELIQILEEKTKIVENITPEIEVYVELYNRFSPRFETKFVEFIERNPLMKILITIHSLNDPDDLVERPEETKQKYRELSEGPDYLTYLKLTFQAFPALTSFLIRELKEEIAPHLNSLSISDQLPLESRVAFLPLFSPDQIWETISAVPKETQAKWLEAEIQYEQFSGRVGDVLTELAANNLRGADQETLDNLLMPLKGLIKRIPLSTLTVLAATSPEIILLYTFVFDDVQMASVVPMLPDEALFQHLMKQWMPTHLEYLLYATTRQKEAYISDDVMVTPKSLAEWDQNRTQIEELINSFENEKSKERFQALEEDWIKIVYRTINELRDYNRIGEALQNKLLKDSPNKEYEEKVISYFEPKRKNAAEVSESLKIIEEKIEMVKREVLGYVEIPEEFLDAVTAEIMVDPYHHPMAPNCICDASLWKKLTKHPTTREPFKFEDLVPTTELQAKIEAFRKHAS